MPEPIKSNLPYWKQLQDDGYFDTHPCYKNLDENDQSDVALIERFIPLESSMTVAIIGCGYGRESATIGRRVSQVYGIDVNEKILNRTLEHVTRLGLRNFRAVLAESFVSQVPTVDFVYSFTVMQHLTRDLVEEYFREFAKKLSPRGMMLVQFLEHIDGGGTADAELKLYEPSVSWNAREIVAMLDQSGLALDQIVTQRVTPGALWHWVAAKLAAK